MICADNSRVLGVRLDGGVTSTAMISVICIGRAKLPHFLMNTADADIVRPRRKAPARLDTHGSARGRLIVSLE